MRAAAQKLTAKRRNVTGYARMRAIIPQGGKRIPQSLGWSKPRERFARLPFWPSLCRALNRASGQSTYLPHVVHSLVIHLLQGALNRFPLRIQDGGLESDVNVSFHWCRSIIRRKRRNSCNQAGLPRAQELSLIADRKKVVKEPPISSANFVQIHDQVSAGVSTHNSPTAQVESLATDK